MTVFGSSVVINPEAGLLVFGMGLITRPGPADRHHRRAG